MLRRPIFYNSTVILFYHGMFVTEHWQDSNTSKVLMKILFLDKIKSINTELFLYVCTIILLN